MTLRRSDGPGRRVRPLVILILILFLVLASPYIRNNRALIVNGLIIIVLAGTAMWAIIVATRGSIVGRLVAAILMLIAVVAVFGRRGGKAGDPARYAALSDSYASGEGASASGEQYSTNMEFGDSSSSHDDPRCHRSTSAYPRRLADDIGRTTLLFVACSGAVIHDVSAAGQYPAMSPQLDDLRGFLSAGGPVDLITVTLSGNDLGFGKMVEACAVPSCTVDARTTTLVDQLDLTGSSFAGSHAQTVLNDLVSTLLEARWMQPRPPNGNIVVVVGYPSIFPATTCGGAMAVFDASELALMRRAWIEANSLIREAARHSGSFFADVADGFRGHEICSPDPWAHGVTAPTISEAFNRSSVIAASSFHPTPAGHAFVAKLILRNYSEPTRLMPPPFGQSLTDQPAVGSAGACDDHK